MGKELPSTEMEPREVRCIFEVLQPIIVRACDVKYWRTFLIENTSDSFTFKMVKITNPELMKIDIKYTAASGNSNDITRKIITAKLYFTPLKSNRMRVCGCPDGTKKCHKRSS